MIIIRILFSHHRYMVVGPVHGRPQQIDRTGINADIVLVNLLFMDGRCNQSSVGAQHKTAQLCIEINISVSGFDQSFLVVLFNDICYFKDIYRLFIRQVGDADAAGQVDKADSDACILFSFTAVSNIIFARAG